ncbi:hypothetical protein BTO04_09120 [Polaribacter sp. SA4-10]|uniref:hypothetical protein n=1 Tax=Polaribacter sp. SA4-10 TaxID=754397 RepID=UPI000B3C9B7F|nr:hypothetical protein [Polaribacter sp. SA4-10]ARV06834.1 hypothetical protein BTO04_09120 [Polaribacter sp. SA4-10]
MELTGTEFADQFDEVSQLLSVDPCHVLLITYIRSSRKKLISTAFILISSMLLKLGLLDSVIVPLKVISAAPPTAAPSL